MAFPIVLNFYSRIFIGYRILLMSRKLRLFLLIIVICTPLLIMVIFDFHPIINCSLDRKIRNLSFLNHLIIFISVIM